MIIDRMTRLIDRVRPSSPCRGAKRAAMRRGWNSIHRSKAKLRKLAAAMRRRLAWA